MAISTSEMSFRDVGINTPLRPDFYEYFPVFTDHELLNRIKYYGALRASNLTIANIRRICKILPKYKDEFCDFIESDPVYQRSIISTILLDNGFSSVVCDAIKSVPRERFVPENLRKLFAIDMSLPITSMCWMSSWSMVALYVDLIIKNNSINNIIEIGLGTAYQAVVLSQIMQKNIIGYEIDNQIVSQTSTNLKQMGFSTIDVRGAAVEIEDIVNGEGDIIYFTCRLTKDKWDDVSKFIGKETIVFAPTSIKNTEFVSAAGSKFFSSYINYEKYMFNYDEYLRIALAKNGEDHSVMYDIRFVPYREKEENSISAPSSSDLDWCVGNLLR